jgi:hypothetical protein
MTMTKKHFKAIAEILKHNDSKEQIVERLICFFRSENELFDESKFREAIKNDRSVM